jgi:hypothetical protein
VVKGNDLVVKILHRGVNVGWGYDGGPIYFHYGANKPLSWMAKSIDDRTNATVTRRGILLTTLTNGPHGIKLHANDTEAQTANSMTYYFSIFNSPLKANPNTKPNSNSSRVSSNGNYYNVYNDNFSSDTSV